MTGTPPAPPQAPGRCRTRCWSRPCWRSRVALGYPLVRQVVLSFQDFGLAQQFGRPPEWVGLAQLPRRSLADGYLWRVTLRSIVFCLVNAALTMPIGVGLALLMRHMSRGVRLLVQTGLLLAWAMPVVASLTVWQWLFDTQYGVVNYVLTGLGLDFEGHGWLLQPLSFFFVATVIVVWMSVPFVAFTVYAALTQLPEELVEAAEIDGAGAGPRFRHVVLPTIRPVLLVVGPAAGHLGPAGLHRRSTSSRRRAAAPATPTCSAPTSTGSASAAVSSACPRRWRSSCSPSPSC